MNWTKAIRSGWQTELASGKYDIIGTLKFNNGRAIGTTRAEALLSEYWKRLDWIAFGSATKAGFGVERWVFTELGAERNLHFHFMAKSPFGAAGSCAIFNAVWSDLARETADERHNWITPVVSAERCADYITKETRFMRDDRIGPNCSHSNHSAPQYALFNTSKQVKRLERTVSLDRVLVAQIEAEKQAEHYK